jgi:hypothetical protein
MNASTQIITPSLAKLLLENNLHNRPLKKSKVSDYANQMKLGLWKLSPEGITISKTGKVLNGQHRLHAVILANINVPFMVFTEVEDELFKTFDTGSKRNGADVFHIEGIKNASTLAAVIALHQYIINKKVRNNNPSDRLSNTQLLDIYYQDSNFWTIVGQKTRVFYDSCKILNPSIIGSCYAIFVKLNEDDCEKFFNELCVGLNLKKTDITWQLRNKFYNDSKSQTKLPITIKMALIIKAWNAMRQDKKVIVLKFDHIREEFPEVI